MENLKIDPLLVTVISTLSGIIITLAIYIKRLYRKQIEREEKNNKLILDIQKEHSENVRKDTISVTSALIGNSIALKEVSNSTTKIQELINTMYIEQIKNQKNK